MCVFLRNLKENYEISKFIDFFLTPVSLRHFAHACNASETTWYKDNIVRGCMIGYHYRNKSPSSESFYFSLEFFEWRVT